MFVYINHSLVCETCAAAGIPDRCVHAMQYLPPWKSYFQLKAIQSMSSRKEKASYFCLEPLARELPSHLFLALAWL